MRISDGANLSGLMAAVVNQAVWDLYYGGQSRYGERGYLASKERRESALEFLASPDLQLFTGFFDMEVSLKDILDNPKRVRKAFLLKSKGLLEEHDKVTTKSRRLAEAKRVRRRADMYKKYQTQPRRSQEFTDALDSSRKR